MYLNVSLSALYSDFVSMRTCSYFRELMMHFIFSFVLLNIYGKTNLFVIIHNVFVA